MGVSWPPAGINTWLTMRNVSVPAVGYTGVYNVLDYSCLSFPTGMTVDKNLDIIEERYQPLGSDCEAINADCK